MNILWLSHLVPYPPKGGVLQRSYNLIRESAKYHDIHLVAFIQKDLILTHFDDYESGIEEAKQKLEEFCKHVSFIDIPCDQSRYGKHLLAATSLLSRNPYTINWLKSEDYTAHLQSLRNKLSFDVVHYDTISLAPYLKIFKETPSVLDHHNIESHMLLRRAENSKNPLVKFYMWQEGKRLQRFEQDWCKQFSVNITCSELDSERLKQLCGKVRVTEIENGVDLEYFKSTSPGNSQRSPASNLRFIFAGRLSAYTNRAAIQYLVHDIWPLIHEKYPHAKLDVVGSSPPEDVVEKASVDTSILVHGFVDDVRTYIDNADIYLCSITDGGGTKLKILDALAMKKAIVSTEIACEGINVQDNIDVLFANTPEEFLEKVDLLVSNPLLINQLGEKAVELVEKQYSYVSIGNKLSSLFEDLCI